MASERLERRQLFALALSCDSWTNRASSTEQYLPPYSAEARAAAATHRTSPAHLSPTLASSSLSARLESDRLIGSRRSQSSLQLHSRPPPPPPEDVPPPLVPPANPDSPPRPAASAPSLPLSAEPAPISLRRRRESSGHSDEASDQARKKLRTSDPSPSAAGVALESNPTAIGSSAGAHVAILESSHRGSVKMVNSPERPGADLPDAHSANGHSSSMTNGHSNGNGLGVAADQLDTDRSTTVSDGDKPSRRLDAMEYEGDEGFVPLWKGSNLDRREFVRLAMQAFEDMGYTCVILVLCPVSSSAAQNSLLGVDVQGNCTSPADRVWVLPRAARRRPVPTGCSRGPMGRRRTAS